MVTADTEQNYFSWRLLISRRLYASLYVQGVPQKKFRALAHIIEGCEA